MRLKLDENLPVTAAPLLRARGYDVDTVRDEGLTGHPDDAVWRAAASRHTGLGPLRHAQVCAGVSLRDIARAAA